MKNLFTTITVVAGLMASPMVFANTPETQKLGTCLVDTLNGKERKHLAKWIFFSIGAHPEIKQFSSATPENIEKSDKYVGNLITKILTVDCPNELKSAFKSNPLAVQQAFELVGKVAMQELMSNQDTLKALTNYSKYAEIEKINQIMTEQ